MSSPLASAPTDADLTRALSAFESPEADPVVAFVQLFDMIRPRRREKAAAAAARYEAFLARLESDPVRAAQVRGHMLSLLGSRRLVSFFADSGILPATGFFTELGRIVTQRLLPELPDDGELRSAVRQVFHRRDDWMWLQAMPQELAQRFWRIVGGDAAALAPLFSPVLDQMLEAMLVIAYRVGGIGVEEQFGRLGAEFTGYAPRFRGLTAAAQRFADAYRAKLEDPAREFEDEAEVLVMVDQCEEVLERARRASMRLGTSLHLTYLMRRTGQSLRRITTLAQVLAARFASQDDPERGRQAALVGWSGMVRDSLRAESRRDSVREHLSKGMALLALRVADNAAKTGEHYVADTREQYFSMWRTAAGAGLIIGAMALLKIFTAKMELPLIGYATLYSLNYGLGFVLIYMLHLTIATKQPAMTAATLAASLDGREDREARLDTLAELAAEVSRTQWVSIAGNVSIAMLTAFAIAMTAGRFLGWEPVDPAKAAHLLHDLHPLRGLALPYAAIAGVYLFLSGLISGYYDNLSLYHQVPQRMRRLKWLRRLLGTARLERLADYVEHNLGALAGNFLFGCMLGFTPVVGELLGLPLDIRHVAFASANFAYGLDGVAFAVDHRVAIVSFAGVLLIGLVNLLVSFSLALKVALRSRGITREQTEGLWGRVLRRFLDRPRDFFWPPAAEAAI